MFFICVWIPWTFLTYPDTLEGDEESPWLEESEWKSGVWQGECELGEGQIFWESRPAASCCISAVAFFLLSLLNNEDFLRILSSLRFFAFALINALCLASFMACGSLLRPPVLIVVVSNAVALSVTASPPEIRICRTWGWNRPWTDSPFIWVTRSPGLRPESQVGGNIKI